MVEVAPTFVIGSIIDRVAVFPRQSQVPFGDDALMPRRSTDYAKPRNRGRPMHQVRAPERCSEAFDQALRRLVFQNDLDHDDQHAL